MDKCGPSPPPYTDGYKVPPIQRGAQIILVQQTAYGPDTQAITCPYCKASGSTRVTKGTSWKTHSFALLLCLSGCWPCVPFVYCADSCLSKKHYCPACNVFLGKYDN